VKSYRPYAPSQPYLLPPSPSEWLPEGHLAYFILDLVEDLDLGDIERVLQAKDPRGERPYLPVSYSFQPDSALSTGQERSWRWTARRQECRARSVHVGTARK
jgi:hypothetical protein